MEIKYSEGFLYKELERVVYLGRKLFNKVGEAGGCQKYHLDVDTIIAAEKAGYFFSVKAERDGQLVGFVGGYRYPHVHHKGVIYATSDVMFVDESLGKSRVKVLKELIAEFEVLAKEKYQVEYVQIAVNANNDIRSLIEKLGYVHTDYVLTKEV